MSSNTNEFEYIHGFTKKEQNRLLHQAEFLAPYVYPGVDFDFTEHILEVGCGVGAQTSILLKEFPKLKIDAVDFSKAQLSRAKVILKSYQAKKRVRLFHQNAEKLSLKKKDYDAAFLCWFLEHVPNPAKVLEKTRLHLKPGGLIYCTEVFNQSLFIEPYSPAFLKYWFEFNDHQWSLKGNPFVGVSLGNLLNSAGYVDVHLDPRSLLFDSRDPKARADFMNYFLVLLLSAEKGLLESGRVSVDLVKEMKEELKIFNRHKDSVFHLAFVRASGRNPLP